MGHKLNRFEALALLTRSEKERGQILSRYRKSQFKSLVLGETALHRSYVLVIIELLFALDEEDVVALAEDNMPGIDANTLHPAADNLSSLSLG